MNKTITFMIILLTISSATYIVSAGFNDWIKNVVTGRATQQDTNASITIVGANAVTVAVINDSLTGTAVDPTENGANLISFNVHVADADGVSDINDSSITGNFTRSGEPDRRNLTCTLVNDIDSTTANYTCSISMYYFDEAGQWTIFASATDIGNKTLITNSSQSFQYDQLQALVISPGSITWATASPGSINQTSNNDPTVLNNTGNYNSPNVTVNAKNLHGGSTPAEFIDVGNLTAGNNTGSNAECNTAANQAANATILVNNTDVQIKQTILNRGNHSSNDGSTGQEQLYWCIRTVPSTISSQTYSTTNSQAWVIKLTT